MSDPQPEPGDLVAHSVIRHDPDGTIHVQHYGAGHVVEGSVVELDLPLGTTVLVRHRIPVPE